MADYSIVLATAYGQRIKLLTQTQRITYTLTVNQIGAAQIDVTGLNSSLFQEDSRLEIWRQVPGGRKYLEGDTCWFIRDWDNTTTRRGSTYTRLIAYSANYILDAPIVAYKSQTSYATKADYADDLIKAIIRENLGSSATDTDRDLSAYISVDADTSDGPSTAKSFSFRNVLATLREIAQDADGNGTPLFFGLTYNPDTGLFTFSTRTQQWGVDHTESGLGRVVLSTRNGTLSEVTRGYISSGERNYIYVGGQGQESERNVVEVEDSVRIGVSPFNRRELFINASNTNDADELMAEGDAALKSYRPIEVLSAKTRDTESIRYGREYKFGDRVVTEHNGRTVGARVDSVQVRVERGREDISVELRADE